MEIQALNYQRILNNTIHRIEPKVTQLNSNTQMLKAAEEFAEIFYKEFLEAAMPPLEGMFGGGQIEKQLNDMLIDEYAKKMSKPEHSVLTRKIYQDLTKKYGG